MLIRVADNKILLLMENWDEIRYFTKHIYVIATYLRGLLAASFKILMRKLGTKSRKNSYR